MLTSDDRERVREMAATVGTLRQHGCIYFGICNNRLKIEAVEQALEEQLAPKGISVARAVLAEREEGRDGPRYLVRIADPASYLSEVLAAERRLFSVHGLSELIRAETGGDLSKVASVSQLLNYRRELFRERALCALFWLDPETVAYLMQKAPDFWSFRSGTAQFEDQPRQSRASPELRPEWQTNTPGSRWLGDLEEKLHQLAIYRAKSPPDESAIASLLLDIGRIRSEKYELQAALESLHEAEELFERLGSRLQLHDVKRWLSEDYYRSGRLDRAEEYARAAIALDGELRDDKRLANDYNDLSRICKARGQLGEAENWLRKAIEIGERLGDELNLAIRYNNLSTIHFARGHLEEAEKWLRRAIEIDERLKDEANLAIRYNNLSQIYQDRGQLEEAESWLRRAIEIDERLGNEPGVAVDYNNLSQIYNKRGELEEAEKWLRKAIEIDERLGDEPSLAVGYNNLCTIYQARGHLEEAEKWLRKAIALMEPKGWSVILSRLKANLEALSNQRQAQPASDSSPHPG